MVDVLLNGHSSFFSAGRSIAAKPTSYHDPSQTTPHLVSWGVSLVMSTDRMINLRRTESLELRMKVIQKQLVLV